MMRGKKREKLRKEKELRESKKDLKVQGGVNSWIVQQRPDLRESFSYLPKSEATLSGL